MEGLEGGEERGMLVWRTGEDQMGERRCESERDGGENVDGGEGGR